MSKQLSAKCTETRKVQISDATSWHTLTIEESRALRGELEKAEEEATRKSAYQKWTCSPSDTPGDLKEAWNAAIDAVLAIPQLKFADIEALKEPGE